MDNVHEVCHFNSFVYLKIKTIISREPIFTLEKTAVAYQRETF
jgi:hypothetical protein